MPYNEDKNYDQDTISFIIGKSIPLTDHNDKMVPNMDVYAQILKLIMQKAEPDGLVKAILIRVYLTDDQKDHECELSLSYDEIGKQILNLMESGIGGCDNARSAQAIGQSTRVFHPKKGASRYLSNSLTEALEKSFA